MRLPCTFSNLSGHRPTLHFAGDDSDFAVLVLAGPLGGDGLRQEGSSHTTCNYITLIAPGQDKLITKFIPTTAVDLCLLRTLVASPVL